MLKEAGYFILTGVNVLVFTTYIALLGTVVLGSPFVMLYLLSN